MHPLGQTRTCIKHNHAFIAPDGHVKSQLPGWTNTEGVILISPQLLNKPRFTQYLVHMQSQATASQPPSGIQRFIYVVDGEIEFQVMEEMQILGKGDFAYVPADVKHQVTAQFQTQLLIFEKRYMPSTLNDAKPEAIIGHTWDGEGVAFLGDEDARVRTLLPDTLAYDMAVNLFTFQSGTSLPFVETHIMEHGLYLLEGQGIYRLAEDWYPIQAGDTIWMGSYCPQWFCAFGKTQSTYIYYKDINRDPLSTR